LVLGNGCVCFDLAVLGLARSLGIGGQGKEWFPMVY
jgi:hypothetical protein